MKILIPVMMILLSPAFATEESFAGLRQTLCKNDDGSLLYEQIEGPSGSFFEVRYHGMYVNSRTPNLFVTFSDTREATGPEGPTQLFTWSAKIRVALDFGNGSEPEILVEDDVFCMMKNAP